jgi:hypothetical protein
MAIIETARYCDRNPVINNGKSSKATTINTRVPGSTLIKFGSGAAMGASSFIQMMTAS